MAVREYIGARYVPLFADPIQWDPTTVYEPLTVVTDQGASYVSRQSVPTGIQLDNTDYWILWADYNAQLQHYIDEVQTFDGRIDDIEDALPIADYSSASTVSDAISTLSGKFPIAATDIDDEAVTTAKIDDEAVTDAKLADNAVTADKLSNDAIKKIAVWVDAYGAVGDGVTDSTAAIQDAIDANPNSQIMFKQGVYIISDTILVNGDVSDTSIDLNGCTVRYAGNLVNWEEDDAVTYRTDFTSIPENPKPMFAVIRDLSIDPAVGSNCVIENGVIDCDYKAQIGIINLAYVSSFRNLRIMNFMFAGLMNGSFINNISSQTMISDCYFSRGDDWSTRETSAMYFTSYDNNISNCVTNRTKWGVTLRCGGNYFSNCHFTIQYASLPQTYTGASVRIYPPNLGTTQTNRFTNCYFNAGRRVCETYNAGTTGTMNMRTTFDNCDYVFFGSDDYYDAYNTPLELSWFGGELAGICVANNCQILTSGNTYMRKWDIPVTPSYFVFGSSRFNINRIMQGLDSVIPTSLPYLTSPNDYIPVSSSGATIPASKYRLVARIVTQAPAYTNLIPGALNFTVAAHGNDLVRKGTIVAKSGGFDVNIDESIGTTSVKMYITKNEHKYTVNGVDYYYCDIVFTAPSNITAAIFMKIEATDPTVDVYSIPNNANFESGYGKNIYDTLSSANLVEVF